MASTVADHLTIFPNAGMSELQSLLLKNTSRKYYIEYNGFMSNHISHGIIALYRLGATVEQIERFVGSLICCCFTALFTHVLQFNSSQTYGN